MTDGQTDGQTDGRAIAYTRYSIYAVARKNTDIPYYRLKTDIQMTHHYEDHASETRGLEVETDQAVAAPALRIQQVPARS